MAIDEPTAMRCWMIDAATGGGVVDGFRSSGFRTLIYIRADANLVVWH